MARISLVSYENAGADVRAVMDGHEAKGYRITNMKRTLLHSVLSFQSLEDGFYNMQERLAEFLDARAIMFFAYAISTEDDCIVCSLYFQDLLEQNKIDINNFKFSETEELLMSYGRQIVKTKGNGVSSELLDKLQERFSEAQLVEITTFAVMMIANNLFNNALKVESELR
ncbi:MAG: hypothetical protein IJM42_06935 [Synergistes sp.]|nr:hypothetical protein [Synergistes sp.]MCR5335396.1 hypothetical protein [Synergistes sp.]